MAKKKLAVDLMLDSGVFSAWNRGETLELKKYIAYLKEHKDWLYSYVNMDVIPGVFGRARSQKEVEDSASGSYANQQRIKDAGLSPIPVFHQGESFKWLDRLLADGEPYIGISSSKDVWANEQRVWLDQVFSMITDRKGWPLVKTHGFGITRPGFLFRYPWFSVDSTAWSLSPGYGQILCPVYVGGKPDYLVRPRKVIMSGVQHKSSSSQKHQFEGLGPVTQEHVKRFLEKEVGVSITQARYGTTVRRRCMLVYYLGLCAHLKNVRFEHQRAGTLTKAAKLSSAAVSIPHLTLMFATSLNREWGMLMNEVGARTRLLSYYELKDRTSETLISFVENGLHGTYKKRTPKTKWSSEAYINYRSLKLVERFNATEPPWE